METLQLTQDEINLLIDLLESQDLEETLFQVSDLIYLHGKLSALRTY
jgi:hypothetical protein